MNQDQIEAAILAEIRKRRADYARADIVEERNKLIELWRAAHPEAAAEPPSAKHHTLDLYHPGDPLQQMSTFWLSCTKWWRWRRRGSRNRDRPMTGRQKGSRQRTTLPAHWRPQGRRG
jgi:hypothetical protein